jgi:protein-S-isoprenylcysteine O-methyltransferase Ste14
MTLGVGALGLVLLFLGLAAPQTNQDGQPVRNRKGQVVVGGGLWNVFSRPFLSTGLALVAVALAVAYVDHGNF